MRFCIKERRGAKITPVFCHMAGQIGFASLEQIIDGAAVMKFGSKKMAQTYIDSHRNRCPEAVVGKIVARDGGIFFDDAE